MVRGGFPFSSDCECDAEPNDSRIARPHMPKLSSREEGNSSAQEARERTWEVILAFLLFAAVTIVSAIGQSHCTAHEGLGWDGRFYYSVAEQFAEHQKPQSRAPFIFRPAVPYLAARLEPHNIMLGFYIVSVVAAGLITALLIIWFRLFLNKWLVRLLLVALFLLEWHAPARFTFFIPNGPDPWAVAACVAGLICLHRIYLRFSWRWLLLLSFICFVGPLIREFVGCLALGALCVSNPAERDQGLRFRWPSLRLWIPLATTMAGIAVCHSIVIDTHFAGYSTLKQAGHFWYYQPLFMYLHSWLIAYGPVLFLPVFFWRRAGRFLWIHQYQLAFLVGIVALSWVGGDDTERYSFWAMPIIYLLCGKIIEQEGSILRSRLLVACLVTTQAFSERLFWFVPQEWGGDNPSRVLLTPLRNVSYLNLYTHFGPGLALGLSLIEYGIVGVIIIWVLRRRQLEIRSDASTALGWKWV